MLNILDKEYPRIDSTLQGEMKNFFLTGYIAESYSNSQSDIESSKVDGFIKSHKLNLSPEGLKYINNIKENSLYLRNNGELQAGDNAPNFDLKDLAGKNYSLSDFKDKFIYLHFWATWCKPCIEEFPALNKLIANVNNDQFVFINVCMDNAYSKWKTIISEKNLMGINLICDVNWSKKLYSLYEISGLPHYTFIDKNGLIIKNNYVRPGNVTTEFSHLLDEK
jgi:peroxiredoxin